MRQIRKIVVASDSFKGSLTSAEVADAVSDGVRSAFPEADIIKVAVSDGGEGMVASIMRNIGGHCITVSVSDPLDRLVEASYILIDNGLTAIIETASASGLTLLSESERNPMITSSFGTGQLIRDALERGCRRIILGLGGSATNDAGTGVLSALGYKFLDENGEVLRGCGESLNKIAKIDSSESLPYLEKIEFVLACDVNNPLYGPSGAAEVFSRQKGADDMMVRKLDDGLEKFSKVLENFSGIDISSVPGSGAAGGIGGGMTAILKAEYMSGIDMLLDIIEFDEIIRGTELVITGEGKIDSQTGMGKVPYGILQRAKAQGIKTMAIAGIIEESQEVEDLGFDCMAQITPSYMQLSEAINPSTARKNIIRSISEMLLREI